MMAHVVSARSISQPDAANIGVEVRNHIGHLILNRPEGLNALNLEMVRQLTRQLKRWAHDDSVQAVVLRGSGDRAFCAGGDVTALYHALRAGTSLPETFFTEEYALDSMLHHYRKPVMVLMDGLTLGGGLGLAQGVDLRVVTERSQLAMPETAIGFFPDVGASYFLNRVPGELGIYLGVTGTRIEAADALYCGLADWYIDSAALADLDRLLDAIHWDVPPLKALQNVLAKLGVQVLPAPPLQRLRPAIDHFFALPDIPSIVQQLREVSIFDTRQWALDTANTLQGLSPLAMAVTLTLLRKGRELSMERCFALELHLARQWLDQGDLLEGVRAQLVDKDKTPRWTPSTIDELSAHQVSQLFNGFED